MHESIADTLLVNGFHAEAKCPVLSFSQVTLLDRSTSSCSRSCASGRRPRSW